MSSEYQEFTGRTVEEALRQAREAFGVSGLDDLDFEILTPGSRGVLGMGAEPARVIAAPRSALGGAAPRRAAAESQPLPPLPERPPREDRGRGAFERGGAGDRERGRRVPAREGAPRGPRDWQPAGPERTETAERAERPAGGEHHERPARTERGGRFERHGDRGAPRRGPREQRGAVSLSEGERAEVAAARSVSTEREEVQAAEASPEALEAGREILQTILGHLGYDVRVTVHTGETSKLDVTG